MKNQISTMREKAMLWWDDLNSFTRLAYWESYQKVTFTPSHSPDDLTGREIEQIYNKELLSKLGREYNEQVEINRDILLENYINNLTDEEKLKAFEIIIQSIPPKGEYKTVEIDNSHRLTETKLRLFTILLYKLGINYKINH